MKRIEKVGNMLFSTITYPVRFVIGAYKAIDSYMPEQIELPIEIKVKEKENDKALKKGYPSPICDSKEETDKNFNAGLYLILSNLNRCELFLGSHSEDSTLRVIDWMKEKKLSKNHSRIWFSQLYGMADHISFNLASAGYQVIKYVPYGPIKEVIPYLIRRAEENTSIKGQTPRELSLIRKELKRRNNLRLTE